MAKPSDATRWLALINFGASILQFPLRGWKRHNLTSTIIKRTNLTQKSSVDVNITPHLVHRREDAKTARTKAVSSKLEDGNISAVVRILCCDDSLADFSEEF